MITTSAIFLSALTIPITVNQYRGKSPTAVYPSSSGSESGRFDATTGKITKDKRKDNDMHMIDLCNFQHTLYFTNVHMNFCYYVLWPFDNTKATFISTETNKQTSIVICN